MMAIILMMRIIVAVLLLLFHKKIIRYRQVFLDFQKFGQVWWYCLSVCYKLVCYKKHAQPLHVQS